MIIHLDSDNPKPLEEKLEEPKLNSKKIIY